MKIKNVGLSLLLSGAMVAAVAIAGPAETAEDVLGNNLSSPGKLIGAGGPALRLPCGPISDPSGPECTLFPNYYCQKTEAVWQAACTTATSATVTATWGANLIDGRLRAGKPIRVEMNLIDVEPAVIDGGFTIEKLTPDLEDRLATYGTRKDPLARATGNYRVFDTGARLKIERCADASCAARTSILDAVMAAEINSLGNIVYGYNWGTKGPSNTATAGYYKITFTPVNATISNTNGQLCDAVNCSFVIVNLVRSGGGGGGGQGGRR